MELTLENAIEELTKEIFGEEAEAESSTATTKTGSLKGAMAAYVESLIVESF